LRAVNHGRGGWGSTLRAAKVREARKGDGAGERGVEGIIPDTTGRKPIEIGAVSSFQKKKATEYPEKKQLNCGPRRKESFCNEKRNPTD